MKSSALTGLAILLAASGRAAAAESRLADAVEKSDRPGLRTLLKQGADLNAASSRS
jgi:hypothetical protein